MAKTKIPVMRPVVGTDTLNGVPVRLLGLLDGESQHAKRIGEEEAEDYMREILPRLLQDENGGELDFNVGDISTIEVKRIFFSVCRANREAGEKAIADFLKPPVTGGSGGTSE